MRRARPAVSFAAPNRLIYRTRSDRDSETLQLLAELKCRNFLRVAGLSMVGAWMVVQMASTANRR